MQMFYVANKNRYANENTSKNAKKCANDNAKKCANRNVSKKMIGVFTLLIKGLNE